jgi:hypothetical protein
MQPSRGREYGSAKQRTCTEKLSLRIFASGSG